ncbi:MAG: acyl carrier protein [Eubacteriales bacterium]|nr:acyl carrier protein [Eubacteriales bacterium]
MSFEKVKEIIAETVNCEAGDISLTSNLKEDLGIDSLDAMEVSMALEEAFGLTIEEEALETFVTVENIVNYIDANK